jgi:hypothetical protein
MRRKGDCWNNAMTETRFGSLKVEQLHGKHFATRRQGKPFDSSPRSHTRIASLRSGDRLAFTLRSPKATRDTGISSPLAFAKKRFADKERRAASSLREGGR